MELEDIILSEVAYTQENRTCLFPFTCGSQLLTGTVYVAVSVVRGQETRKGAHEREKEKEEGQVTEHM